MHLYATKGDDTGEPEDAQAYYPDQGRTLWLFVGSRLRGEVP